MRLLISAVILVLPLVAFGDEAASRLGSQWVTSYAVLDHLGSAVVKSPYLPSKGPLFHRVAEDRKDGTTVQNQWPGDGANGPMHVRVRKVWTPRIQHDLRDCLVVPLPGSATFRGVRVHGESELRFAPEYVSLGGPRGPTLRVVAIANGTEKVIWEKAIPGSSLWKDRWIEEAVSLKAFSGQLIDLRFEIDHASLGQDRWTKAQGKHKGVGLFALPRVNTKLVASDVATRAAVKAETGDEMNHSVIMFVFDSLRADLIPPVREERKRIPSLTPNLDAFVKDGVRFSRAFSGGNQTRVGGYSMYLGGPPSVNGLWQTNWDYTEKTREAFFKGAPESLPRLLHKHGYVSGHLGYNGFLMGNLYLAVDMGFDFISEFNGVPENTVRMTDGILEWIEQHKDQKFFLLVWYDPPHFPYTAPPGYTDRVRKAGWNEKDPYFALGYLAKLMYGDDQFGRLKSKLEDLGLAKKTLFVVTGDHGEAMDPKHDGYSNNVNTRVARMHGKTFYDEEIHVPLVFKLDGTLPRGIDVPNVVSTAGLAPTLTELLGLGGKRKKQFTDSYASLVRGQKQPLEQGVAYFEGRWSYGIRTSKYKYIYHDVGEKLELNAPGLWRRSRDGFDELFDVTADPNEYTNLATTNRAALDEMRKRYQDMRRRLREHRTGVMGGEVPRPLQEVSWPK